MSEKKSARAERLEYLEKRSKELHLSKKKKQKKLKAELIEKFGMKESSAGWESWNFLYRKEKEEKAK